MLTAPSFRRSSTFVPHGAGQRGLSLVELMVGITVGLIVTAGATFMAVNQITEHHRLMQETQMQQDLRTVGDVIQQDIQRAGFRGRDGYDLWAPPSTPGGASTPSIPNQFSAITVNDTKDQILYQYLPEVLTNHHAPPSIVPTSGQFGIKLKDSAIYIEVGANNWQPVTDPNTITISQFTVKPNIYTIPLEDFCDKPCSTNGNGTCIQQNIRRYGFTVVGTSTDASKLTRTMDLNERVKDDEITGACPP